MRDMPVENEMGLFQVKRVVISTPGKIGLMVYFLCLGLKLPAQLKCFCTSS